MEFSINDDEAIKVVYDKNKLQKGKPKQQSNAPLEALEQLWKGPVEDSFMKTVNARREARVQARSTSCDASKPSRGRPQAKAADEKKTEEAGPIGSSTAIHFALHLK